MNSDTWALGESSSDSVGAGEYDERDKFFDSKTQDNEMKDERECIDAKDQEKVDEEEEEEEEEEKESGEAYRRRVYENTYAFDASTEPGRSSVRRLSRRLSHRLERSSSLVSESLPDTPKGWAALVSALGAAFLGYEIQLQKSLTCPPLVYAHHREGRMKALYEKLTETPNSILRRTIQPSLFVGTRATVSSTAGYMSGGPSASEQHIFFREIMKMSLDGGTVAIDWELPVVVTTKTRDEQEQDIRNGSIDKPVIIIIHGLNNHANFGYVRSMMRACSNRGWIAARMNLRGCGGVPLSTPRGYNAAYTGDIRCVVQRVSARLAENVPIFLIGNSLSASLVTKYLGEEGLSGTLPKCVAGGAALGTPANMDARTMKSLFSPLLALGTKKYILENWATFRHLSDPHTLARVRRAMLGPTLAEFDQAIAPFFLRNDPIYPFSYQVGFKGKSFHIMPANVLVTVLFASSSRQCCSNTQESISLSKTALNTGTTRVHID
jgi:predicted alpha/beta-fold hydrolase